MLPRLLPYFLRPHETTILLDLARLLPFEPGRLGTGYEKAAIPEDLASLLDLRLRGLALFGLCLDPDPEEIPPFVPIDCYLLRYREGSHAPPHVDPGRASREHWRLNAIIQEPGHGGDLYVGGIQYFLQQSDAVLFRPDEQPHEVTPVQGQDRLVWSLGALLPAR